jgi:hypothetical protein
MNLELTKTRAAEAEPRSRRWERTAAQIAAIRLRGLSDDIAESHWRMLDERLAELFTAGAFEMVGAAFNEFDAGLLAAAKAEYERQRKVSSNGVTEAWACSTRACGTHGSLTFLSLSCSQARSFSKSVGGSWLPICARGPTTN